jgi:tRNA nucleotidyltransferase (CCA-adding enzyme)
MVRIYQVGGSVRDKFLGVPSKDIDYAVETESYENMREYILSRGKIYLETPRYFTIRAHVDGLGDADFVLCRKDGDYLDGRRPDTVEVGTLADDLARRDFTMNAIAIDMDSGVMIDPYNGRADLEAGLICCVRDAHDRFAEDALRMLRALRFSITRNMRISAEIDSALFNPDLLKLLDIKISWERKKDELYKMFKCNSLKTIRLLKNYPSLMEILFNNTLWLEPTLKGR